jgi:hypothetical protein
VVKFFSEVTMPEILTKYPDTVIQLLHESGARCGADVPRQILLSCPPESFCSLPTGEVCIYGLPEVRSMTQMTPVEIVKASGKSLLSTPEVLITVFLIFVAGALFGNFLSRRTK